MRKYIIPAYLMLFVMVYPCVLMYEMGSAVVNYVRHSEVEYVDR